MGSPANIFWQAIELEFGSPIPAKSDTLVPLGRAAEACQQAHEVEITTLAARCLKAEQQLQHLKDLIMKARQNYENCLPCQVGPCFSDTLKELEAAAGIESP